MNGEPSGTRTRDPLLKSGLNPSRTVPDDGESITYEAPEASGSVPDGRNGLFDGLLYEDGRDG